MAVMRPVAVLLAALAVILTAGSAGAQVDVTTVQAQPVSVQPGAPLSETGRTRLLDGVARLRERGNDTRVVVLAARPADPDGYIAGLWSGLGRRGDLLVLYPGGIRIASDLGSQTVNRAYARAQPSFARDPIGGTLTVADGLATVRAGGSLPTGRSTGTGGGGGFLVVLLAMIGLGGLAATVAGRRARRRALQRRQDVDRQNEEAERAALEPLVDALAAQVNDLESDMATPGPRTDAARADADRAILAYGEARDGLASARTIVDVRRVGATLESGLRAARRAQAVIDGRSPEEADHEPLLEGMCTFNPRHGRAVTTAEVMTPSGDAAEVPVCSRCAEGLARGERPDVREVELGGRRVPYWETAGVGGFGGFGGFGGAGGVMGGALLGVLLGGMMTGGHAWGAPGGWDAGDGFGGGDFGGGDFGGGDFGGGDFGGGDFG